METGDLGEHAWALGHLAAALAGLGQLDEAPDHIGCSIALFTEFGDGLALDRTHNTYGEILCKMGRYHEALAAHRAVLTDAARRARQLPLAVARAHRGHRLALTGMSLPAALVRPGRRGGRGV